MKTFVLVVAVILFPTISSAQVHITEVMYDLAEGSDSGREWIEIYNTGQTGINAMELLILENTTKHAIAGVVGGSEVAVGAYAVIADNPAKFKVDWPYYGGLLFDSAFSLNNTGETIGIATADGTVLDTVTYTHASANGTGDSLQRAPGSGQFNSGMSTPGVGIPAGGLTISPPKQKASKKSAQQAVAAAAVPTIVGERSVSSQVETIVAKAPTEKSPWQWWLAPLLLAATSSVGIVWSRHLKKDEWDITEEDIG